jgi:hypothetical protein
VDEIVTIYYRSAERGSSGKLLLHCGENRGQASLYIR